MVPPCFITFPIISPTENMGLTTVKKGPTLSYELHPKRRSGRAIAFITGTKGIKDHNVCNCYNDTRNLGPQYWSRDCWVFYSTRFALLGAILQKHNALRVQVPNNHILAQNLYYNYYYPKTQVPNLLGTWTLNPKP